MTGQSPPGGTRHAGQQQGAPATHRPFMVWGALVMFAAFGLIKVFFSVLIFFGTIRDDQVHEGSVPGGLWVLFAVLLASGVVDAILGLFIFRGARWAWITAVTLAALGIVLGVVEIGMSGGFSIAGLMPDIATLGVLLNHNVREWCIPGRPVRDRDDRQWYPGAAR